MNIHHPPPILTDMFNIGIHFHMLCFFRVSSSYSYATAIPGYACTIILFRK